MTDRGTPSTPSHKNGWHAFARRVLQPLFSPHFIIAITIVFLWYWSIATPITSIAAFNQKMIDATPEEVAAMQELVPTLRESIVVVSLATTVLALVLGYFFGQTSEAAKTAKEQEAKQDIAEDYVERTEKHRAQLEGFLATLNEIEGGDES